MAPSEKPTSSRPHHRDGWLLAGIWLGSLVLDLIWLQGHQLPPAWDQGDHLSRALNIWQVLRQPQPLTGDWWHQLWAQAPSYRGPLTYLVTAPLFSLLGPSYASAILSNSLFNGLLLVSVYGQGRLLASRQAGLWAAWFCAVAPALLNQRSDYLIDFSLTAVLAACWTLLSWRHLGVGATGPTPGRSWRRPWLASGCCGLALGALLLTRPTGLLLLWLPLAALALRAAQQLLRGRWWLAAQGLLAAWLAWLVAGGWIGQNWLTIVSTVNNARRWGVLYQEGLEPTSLAGWLYYPKLLPAMAGASMVGLVLAGWLLAGWLQGGRLQGGLPRNSWHRRQGARPPANAAERWRLAWWLSFPLGGLLLASLMSTKDFRFVLPLLPQLLLLLAWLVSAVGASSGANSGARNGSTSRASSGSGPWRRYWRGAIVLVGISGLLACQFGIGANLTAFASHAPQRQQPSPQGKQPSPQGKQPWPLEEIVATIRRQSPQQLSTLAVLPDSEFLNAFNLEAEGRRQQFRVAARQTLAPLEHLEEDLAGFDWFLLKGGDQGVMSDERQAKLSQLVKRSPAFSAAGRWALPDGSGAELYRRRQLSLAVAPAPCGAGGQPLLELIDQGGGAGGDGVLVTRLVAPARLLRGSRLLIDGHDRGIGQGLLRPDQPSGCLAISERLASKQPLPAQFQASLLLASGQRLPLQSRLIKFTPATRQATAKGPTPGATTPAAPNPVEGPAMPNRIDQLLELGQMLRQGQLDELFARVGRINQQDPEQVYLIDGEAILQARLRRDPTNLDLLYPLALAQALQRRAEAAALSLSRIGQLDPSNANAKLGLGFVQLYRFKPWAAQPALDQAAQLEPANGTLHTLRAVAAAMRLNLAEAHSLITR
jgi:4-amino-4-deoxy-L-arabinose transferase-like glycosyltransferase